MRFSKMWIWRWACVFRLFCVLAHLIYESHLSVFFLAVQICWSWIIFQVKSLPISPGLSCKSTELIPLTDVSDIYNVSTGQELNEFIIRRRQGVTVYFSSPSREPIVKVKPEPFAKHFTYALSDRSICQGPAKGSTSTFGGAIFQVLQRTCDSPPHWLPECGPQRWGVARGCLRSPGRRLQILEVWQESNYRFQRYRNYFDSWRLS